MNEVGTPGWVLAARQHGVVKSAQLGLSRAGVAKWVRDGRLHRKYRGVYAYGHPHLSREGRWMAAVLAAGHGAALASLSAACLHRTIRYEPRVIHVIAPLPRTQQRGMRLHTCRNLDPRDVTVVNGIPVTTMARTLVDLTDALDADELANVIHEAAYRTVFDLDATRAALARARGRRLVVLSEALRLHESGSAGSRSRLEQRFLKLARAAGLAAPVRNTVIHGEEVDFRWERLCVEVDGLGHRRPRTRAEDRIRDAVLRAAGCAVIRFAEADIDTRPGYVIAALRELVRSAQREREQAGERGGAGRGPGDVVARMAAVE